MHDDQFPPRFGEELERDRPARDPDGLMHLLWFVYVFVRPRRFFDRFARTPAPAITFACAITFGISRSVDRIDTRVANDPNAAQLFSSWTAYWVMAMIAGVISAALLYLIGGWWYRVRLRWSGAQSPDKHLARRVYVYSAQIVAVPTLIYAVVRTSVYANPLAVAQAPLNPVDFALLATPLYSFVVSHIGVRSVFDVRPMRAAFWFLVLPGALYMGILAFVVVAFLNVGGIMNAGAGPPELDSPSRVDQLGVRFEHPSNWWVSSATESDGVTQFVVQAPQDAIAQVVRYSSIQTASEELEQTVSLYASEFPGIAYTRSFDTLGTQRGAGEVHTYRSDAGTYTVRLFVTDDGYGNMTEFHTMCLEGDADMLEPGYELIHSSIR